ncbi:MAG: phosphoglycerate mutase family protein [Ferruginibacter sp.]
MKFLLSAIILLLLVTSCSHTYYIVRHAEKAQVAGDPPLSEAGKQRAEKLKEILKGKKIKYIFSTNTIRTLSTAKPLSDAIGIKTVIYDPRKDSVLIAQLKTLKKNVLIVGHSNTIDDIVNKLCNAKKIPADIDDAVYDNLFIVTYHGKKINFKQEKY